ncbi:aminoglycoside phosphotransferase [Afipia sp. P52-10]|uniref:phosphotransferase n=1 Tax=Afipia sp. P52-10 TaxID=1429916 RepID=UPI0003DF42C5|nr:phosphotransferase [Afipia sp. P52-10]ETR78799.1 aminoglycoside phosphotransferase [Afipia sp. P52-10]
MTTQTLPPMASAAHLTDALRRAEVLDGARVSEVVVESSQNTVLSRIVRLELRYDGDAPRAPKALILKSCHPDRAETFWFAGEREVAFYTQAGARMPAGIVPHCFEAVCDPASKTWHLLLEDLALTHRIATAWPLPPTQGQCESIVCALARLHAAWWDDPRLGNEVGKQVSAAERDAWLTRFAGDFGKFCDFMSDRLSQERRVLFERLLAQHERVFADRSRRGNITISHGDAHVWNVLLPREGTGGTARWFDWDAWSIDTGANDLAYMIAMHWYSDRRALLEQRLLDRYHEELVACGVTGYSRAALDTDYRRSALLLIGRPVWQWANNIPPVIWWNNLERILLAVDDLGARELLD